MKILKRLRRWLSTLTWSFETYSGHNPQDVRVHSRKKMRFGDKSKGMGVKRK